MKVLFLTINRFSDINKPGIYTDLLRTFKENGHEVYVVAAGQKRYKLSTSFSEENGIKVLRVRTGNITKTNSIEKGIATLMLETQYLQAIKDHLTGIRFDLVLYSTPPITFERVIRYIKKRDNCKSYLLLKDIFPQNAVDLGFFSKWSPIYWLFRYKEKRLYQNSDYIGCMSKANVDFVVNHNPTIPRAIVEVCPNSILPISRNNSSHRLEAIRSKYDLPTDKTLFLYGGNLGKPQGIDFLIETLKLNESNRTAHFVIVGSGTEFGKLQKFFYEYKPQNSTLLNQLPKSDYELLANSCDVGLIYLDKRFTIPNFPSRILSYMQASMPVLAATDTSTDIGKVIEEGGFGFWCESGDDKKFNQLVNRLCDSKLRESMGRNAWNYLVNNYTVQHSYEIIMKHFE